MPPKNSPSKKRPRGRAAGSRIYVQAPYIISATSMRLGLKGEILTFQDIANKLTERSGVTITRMTVWRFAHGIDPHSAKLRRVFGLPVFSEIEVCRKCGKPHEMLKQCGPRKPRSTSATPRRNWKRLATWAAAMVMNMPRDDNRA